MLKTYGDLKKYFNNILEEIEDVPDSKELHVSCNTYRQYGTLLSIPGQGYINLNELTPEDEDEED